MRVAVQGEAGSFSHVAARRLVSRCTLTACSTFAQVFDRVESGDVGAGVIPIENTLGGALVANLDLLLERDVFIRRELHLRIAHQLIAAPGVRLRDVRRVLSHPAALEQCRRFFTRRRSLTAVPFFDTAGAVRHVVEQELSDAAAIASEHAAKEHGATILRRGLEDNKQNYTRFLLISRRRSTPPRADKTSIAFAMRDVPGALFKALAIFALREINLSRIESRPAHGRPFEYVFYVDLLRGSDRDARNALRHLSEITRFVKILGIYRRHRATAG